MFSFRPTSTSSPAKSIATVRNSSGPSSRLNTTADASRSTATSLTKSDLQNLSPGDVQFLDAVIARIPSNATSFLAGLKAYNDELHERGWDSLTETVHYGRLLELCKLRGPSWAHKWSCVKSKYGYNDDLSALGSSSPSPAMTRRTPGLATLSRDEDDVFTLHSHQDGIQTEDAEDSSIASPTPPKHRTYSSSEQTIARGPDRLFAAWDEASNGTEGIPLPSTSTTPPSYRTAVNHASSPVTSRNHLDGKMLPLVNVRSLSPSKASTSKNSMNHPGRKDGKINEADAWRKIKEQRDEEDAIRFYQDKLVERSWDVWKSGQQWIHTRDQQVDEARNNIILESYLRTWRDATANLLDQRHQADIIYSASCLQRVLHVWSLKTRLKRQAAWREDMRAKMKEIRNRREAKQQKDAWARWRQLYLSHLNEMHFQERLAHRFFRRWQGKMIALDVLGNKADDRIVRHESGIILRVFEQWKRAVSIRETVHLVMKKSQLRVLREGMDVWRKQIYDRQLASDFYDKVAIKRAMEAWKTSRDRIRGLERRADKHTRRQDVILERVVMRVWKARERAILLERVKAIRTLKYAWTAWVTMLDAKRRLQSQAVHFLMRASSTCAVESLRSWQQMYQIYQNRHVFAVQRHSARIQSDALFKWRILLRSKLKLVKQAKVADKFFLQRRTLKAWHARLQQRTREKKVQEFHRVKAHACFNVWLQKSREQRWRKLAEQQVLRRVSLRVMSNALTRWTNRVIDVKLRELEVRQRTEVAILTRVFKKWKFICVRHAEELSLMESHLDIKRLENMRRMFHRWLSVARARLHKRVTIAKSEEMMRQRKITAAWDKWQDRFRDEKLKPIEYQVIVQSQRNLVFRAFGIWHSRTKSLPAIRFDATRTKAKYWEVWRNLTPDISLIKKAREWHRTMVLSRVLEKWDEQYRTKRQLKEIARARYLRLAVPKTQVRIGYPSSNVATPVSLRNPFPRRNVHLETDTEDSDAPQPPGPQTGPTVPSLRHGITSLLAKPRTTDAMRPSRTTRTSSPARSAAARSTVSAMEPNSKRLPRPVLFSRRQLSPTRSRASGHSIRDSSAAPSIAPSSAAGEPERSRLWQELRQIQRRSQPPTEKSPSPSRKG